MEIGIKYARRFERFHSIYYQFYLITDIEGETILEVGKGYGILNALLKWAGYKVTTLDVNPKFKPDITADIRDIELPHKYDIVCAFEVLEHMPYKDAMTVLKKLASLSKKGYVVISVPRCREIKWRLISKKLRDIGGGYDRYRPHYWEIGRKGYRAGRVLKDIRADFDIIKAFCPPANKYHFFMTLRKKG